MRALVIVLHQAARRAVLVYGGRAILPTPELVELRPRSRYTITKCAREQYCLVFGEALGGDGR
jgi:hypothetical protein